MRACLVALLLEGVDRLQVIVGQQFTGRLQVQPDVAKDTAAGARVGVEFLWTATRPILPPLVGP